MTNPFLGNPFADLTEDLEDDPFADLTADLKPQRPRPEPVTATRPKPPTLPGMDRIGMPQAPAGGVNPFQPVRPTQTPGVGPRLQQMLPDVTAVAPKPSPVEQSMGRMVMQGTRKTDPFGAKDLTPEQQRQVARAQRARAMANVGGEFGVQAVGGVADAALNAVQGLGELADMALPGDPGIGDAIGRGRELVSERVVGQPETGVGMVGRGAGYLAGTLGSYLLPSTLAARAASTAGGASRALNFLANPIGRAGLTVGGNVNRAGQLASGAMLTAPVNVAMGLSPDNTAEGFVQLGQMMEGKEGRLAQAAQALGAAAEPFSKSPAGKIAFEFLADFAPNAAVLGVGGAFARTREGLTYVKAVQAARDGNRGETIKLVRQLRRMQEAGSVPLLTARGGQPPAPEMPAIPKRLPLTNTIKADFERRLQAALEASDDAEVSRLLARQQEVLQQRPLDVQLQEAIDAGDETEIQRLLDLKLEADLTPVPGQEQRSRFPQRFAANPEMMTVREELADVGRKAANALNAPGARATLARGAVGATVGATAPEDTRNKVAAGVGLGLLGAVGPRRFLQGIEGLQPGLSTQEVRSDFGGTLYSKLERAIASVPEDAALTPQQWRKVLSSNYVDGGEVKYRGVGDILDATPAKRTITRQQLQETVAANPIRITDEVQAGKDAEYSWLRSKAQMEGSKNYREILIGLDDPNYRFEGPHWSQVNVMPSLRVSDRTDIPDVMDTGKKRIKTLHVEEIQDDAAQRGRQVGFGKEAQQKYEADKARFNQLYDERAAILGQLNSARINASKQLAQVVAERFGRVYAPYKQPSDELMNRLFADVDDVLSAFRSHNSSAPFEEVLDDAESWMRQRYLEVAKVVSRDELAQLGKPLYDLRVQDNVANAAHMQAGRSIEKMPTPERPYKETPEWTELAVKRAIEEAVANGYDQIMFATAKQAAAASGGKVRQLGPYYDETVPKVVQKYLNKLGILKPQEMPNASPLRQLNNSEDTLREQAVALYEQAQTLLNSTEMAAMKAAEEAARDEMVRIADSYGIDWIDYYNDPRSVPDDLRAAGQKADELYRRYLPIEAQAKELEAQGRKLEARAANANKELTGNYVLAITPEIRRKVAEEGQPLWAMGGDAGLALGGGLAGATEGETTEDRLANAILAAGVIGGVGNRNVLRSISDKVLGKMHPKTARLVQNLDPETGYAPPLYAALRGMREELQAMGRNPELLRERGAAQAQLAQQIRQSIEAGELGPQHELYAETAERMARAIDLLARNAEQAPAEAVRGTRTVLDAHRAEVAKRMAENPDLERIATEGTVQEKVQAVVDFAKPILRESTERAIREYGTDAKWYDEAVRNMQSLVTLVMPELSEPRLFMLFNYMGSILSNGNPVSPELNAALVAMQQYLRTGKFSVFAQAPEGGYAPKLRVKSTAGSGVTERPMFAVGDDADVLKGGPKFRSWEASLKKLNEVMERHGGDVDSALRELAGRGFTKSAESRIKGLMKQGKTFDEALQLASVDARGRPVEIYAKGDAKNRLRSTQLFGPKVGQYGTDKTMWLRGEVELPFPQSVRENATNDLWMARLYNMALGVTPLSPKGALSDNVTGPMHTVLNEVQRRLGREVGMEVLGRPMDARNVQALLWEAMKSRYGQLGVKVEKGAFDTLETAAVNYLLGTPAARGVDEVEAIARARLSGYRPGFIDRQLMNEIAGKGTLVAGGLAMRNAEDERLRMTGNAAIGAVLGSLAYKGAIRPAGKAFVAGMADGLRQSEGGRQLLTALSRDFTTDPRVIEVVNTFRQQLAQGTAVGRELAGEARRLGPQGNRLVSDLVEGEAFEATAGMSPEDMAVATALANRIADAVQVMGQEKVGAGLLSPATLAKRERSYLRRMYAKFDAADAAEDVTVNAKGKTFRIEGERIRNDDLTPEERLAMGEIREADYRLAETFGRGYRDIASAKLFNALREMPGVLQPEYATAFGEAATAQAFHKQLLAERKAATTAAERSALEPLIRDARQAMLEAKGRVRDLQQRFKEAPPADMLGVIKRAGKDDYVRMPDTPSMGVLRGAVVRRDVADYLNDIPEMSSQSSAFGRLLTKWKVIHTVYNTGTQIGNFVSNVANAHMGGIPWWMQGKEMFWDGAVKDIRNYGPATRALAEAGVLDRGLPLYGDLPSKGLYEDKLALRQLATTTRPETRAQIEAAGLTPMGKGEQLLRRGQAAVEKSYAMGDAIYRVMLMRKYLKDGLSQEDAVAKVLEYMPTYDTRSPLLKGLRGTVSPFIMYTAKTVPMLLDKIAQHPERWATLAATWAVVDQWSRRKYGAMAEEDLPPNQRMGKTGYFLPQRVQVDALLRPFMDIPADRKPTIDVARFTPLAALTGSPAPGSLATQLGEDVPGILQPGGPMVSLGAQLTNTDPYTGEKLIRPSDTAGDIAAKLGQQAASYLLPSFASFHIPRVIRDLRAGDPDKAAVDALGILGMRPTMVEPGMQALRDLRRFEDQRRDLTTQFRRDLRDTKDPERRRELQQRYRDKAQRFRQEYQERRGK